MEYKDLEKINKSAACKLLMRHLRNKLSELQNTPIDPSLNAEEYKINALGKDSAVVKLREVIQEIDDFEEIDPKDKEINDIYYNEN